VSGVEGTAPGGSAGRDVLARLAARSVGQGAAARPRPRSRFEVSTDAQRHGGAFVEGIDTTSRLDDDGGAGIEPASTTPLGLLRRRATGRSTGSTTSAGAGAADRSTAGRARSTGADDGAGSGPVSGTASGHAPGDDSSGPDHGARGPLARPLGPRPDPTGAPSAGTPLGPDRPIAETPFDRDHLGVVAARPAGRPQPTSASPVRAGDEPGPTGRAADRAPVVQIHIGRLDVRANLDAAPAAAPPVPTPTEPGLSLADYLAGKRGTR